VTPAQNADNDGYGELGTKIGESSQHQNQSAGAGYAPMPAPAPVAAQPVIGNRKSKTAAALLAFFLGGFGVHNFYLGRTGRAVTQLICFTIGWLFIIPACIVAVWAFIEFLLIVCAKSGSEPWGVDGNGVPLGD
jgi:hypothetical protein